MTLAKNLADFRAPVFVERGGNEVVVSYSRAPGAGKRDIGHEPKKILTMSIIVNGRDISLGEKTPKFLQEVFPFAVALAFPEHFRVIPRMTVFAAEIEGKGLPVATLEGRFFRIRMDVKSVPEGTNARFQCTNEYVLVALTDRLHHFSSNRHISPPQP